MGLKENVIIGKLIPAGTGMKRYKNIDLDYGVNTALMEAYSAMLAEVDDEEYEEYAGDNDEAIVYSEEVYEVDEVETAEENEEIVAEPEGIASEIFEFEE